MTKNQALQIAWAMIAAEFVNARRRQEDPAAAEWLLVLDRIERTWPWLKQKREDVPRLADLPDDFPMQEV